MTGFITFSCLTEGYFEYSELTLLIYSDNLPLFFVDYLLRAGFSTGCAATAYFLTRRA